MHAPYTKSVFYIAIYFKVSKIDVEYIVNALQYINTLLFTHICNVEIYFAT